MRELCFIPTYMGRPATAFPQARVGQFLAATFTVCGGVAGMPACLWLRAIVCTTLPCDTRAPTAGAHA